MIRLRPITLNSSTYKYLGFASADGYDFTNNVYVGNKQGYCDGKTGIAAFKDGYIHLQRANGDPYIGFWLEGETGWAEGKAACVCLNAEDNLLHFELTSVCVDKGMTVTNNATFNSDIHLGTAANYLDKARSIGTWWADKGYHYLVSRNEDGLTTYLGWAGSESYKTVTTIRGQTCKYHNSAGSTTLSDERLKKDFASLEKWDAFFNALEPCAFKMKAGASGRYHIGFKAQQVEQALLDSGLTSQDFAGFIKSKYTIDSDDPVTAATYEEAGIKPGDDEYGLIYTEFTALNTFKIQQLQKENTELKQKVDDLESRLAKLESLLAVQGGDTSDR